MGFAWNGFARVFFIALRNNPSTVSFRGTVVEINNINEESVYIKALMIFGTVPRTIRVDGNVSIRNLISGEKMSIDEINIGDMIDLDVRGRWDDVTAIIIPRWIRVLPKQ